MDAIVEAGARPAQARKQPREPGAATRLRRLARGLVRRTSTTGLVLYALLIGAGLGLVSADMATGGGYLFGGVTIGAWTAWPRTGSVAADPYARAVNARRGEIPLALGEGMLMTATKDDEGAGLDAACTYRLGGVTPPARAWTLTIAADSPPETGAPPLREGFTSTEVLRDAEGRFKIAIGSEVQPGNWLPMPAASGAVRLALRLYDTPVAASVGTLDRDSLPAITRIGCR